MLVIVQKTLIISFSKKRPKFNKCCHLIFFISCVLCLTHVVLVALVMTIEMEHCDIVHLMCVKTNFIVCLKQNVMCPELNSVTQVIHGAHCQSCS